MRSLHDKKVCLPLKEVISLKCDTTQRQFPATVLGILYSDL